MRHRAIASGALAALMVAPVSAALGLPTQSGGFHVGTTQLDPNGQIGDLVAMADGTLHAITLPPPETTADYTYWTLRAGASQWVSVDTGIGGSQAGPVKLGTAQHGRMVVGVLACAGGGPDRDHGHEYLLRSSEDGNQLSKSRPIRNVYCPKYNDDQPHDRAEVCPHCSQVAGVFGNGHGGITEVEWRNGLTRPALVVRADRSLRNVTVRHLAGARPDFGAIAAARDEATGRLVVASLNETGTGRRIWLDVWMRDAGGPWSGPKLVVPSARFRRLVAQSVGTDGTLSITAARSRVWAVFSKLSPSGDRAYLISESRRGGWSGPKLIKPAKALSAGQFRIAASLKRHTVEAMWVEEMSPGSGRVRHSTLSYGGRWAPPSTVINHEVPLGSLVALPNGGYQYTWVG